MKIPILSRLWDPRAGPKNSFLGSTYGFFFGSTISGKTVNEKQQCKLLQFIEEIKQYNESIEDYEVDLLYKWVEKITVMELENFEAALMDGTEIEVRI